MGKKIVQIVQRDLGNTETKSQPKKEQQIATKRYCFTKNDIPQNEEGAKIFYRTYSAKIKHIKNIVFYVFSLEKGENEGTYHLQGYMELSIKARITEFKEIEATAHFEKSKGNKQQNIDYCSKGDTHIEGPTIWDKSKEPKYTAEELGLIEPIKLYNWQRDAINIAQSKPDRRSIHWFFETEGNVGKTELARHLIYYHKFGLIEGAKKDIMCSILGEDGTKEIMRGYVFNFSRDKEGKVSYDSMESIKDGLIFSSKYKSTGGIIPPCHIFVFANWKPDLTKMSLDRWKIYNIKDKALIELNKPQKQDIELEGHIEDYNVSFD